MHVEFYFLFALNGSIGIERNIESVTHSCSLYYCHCRGQFGQIAMNIFYHFYFLLDD